MSTRRIASLRLRSCLTVLCMLACCPRAVASSPGTVQEDPGVRIQRRLGLMGTSLLVEVEHETRGEALRASEAAVRALEASEARLSTWVTASELAALNRAPVGERHALSPELERDLRAAHLWYVETAGAFDPGLGALVEAWGLRSGGSQPDTTELERARESSGMSHLVLGDGFAVRTREGLLLEEGAFGKGAGLDRALDALRREGARGAVLDLGGQVAVLGPRPHPVGIAHPVERDLVLLHVTLDDGSLATSGNSERGIEVDGRKLGHLLDPRTGRPVPDFGSLSVLAATATAADCLSTALYVLGPDSALAWAAQREGVDVLVLEVDGGEVRARATPGLFERLEVLDTELRIELQGGRIQEK